MGGGQPTAQSASDGSGRVEEEEPPQSRALGRSHGEAINAHGVVHVRAAGHVDTGNRE